MQTDLSNIRCIAFDLDDTILNENKELSERTKAETSVRISVGGIHLQSCSLLFLDNYNRHASNVQQ